VIATRNSQSKAGMVISAPTHLALAAERTRCSHQEIVSQAQRSSEMCHYSLLVVQTGRMMTVTQYVGSLMWGTQFIVIVIAITHLFAFRALVTTIIVLGPVRLSAISIRVSSTASGAGILTIIEAAAAQGFATGILISAATAASGFTRTVAGVAARSRSICHSALCMLLCRFELDISALDVQGIHGLSPFIRECISISRPMK